MKRLQTASPSAEEQAETLTAARDYVWKSFDLHFKQRTEFLRFYITILLPIYAAYGVVLKEKLFAYGIMVSAFTVITTILFAFLDRRAQTFMWDYRAFMLDDEARMAQILDNPLIKLFEASSKRNTITYRGMYVGFFAANCAIAVIFALYCLCEIYGEK